MKLENVNYNNYSVAILAGGKGTRIQSLFPDIPKPLINISGKPVIFRQIDFFLKYGITKIMVLAGFKGEIIKEAISKIYSDSVDVFIEEKPLDTSGCLSLIKNKITTKYLIIVSGDLVFDIDLERFCNFHQKQNSQCTLTVHSNFHPMDADLISFDEISKKINKLLIRPHSLDSNYLNNVNAAISILNAPLLSYINKNFPQNFERDFIPILLKNKINMYAYKSIEYIRDMGTPERFKKIENELSRHLPEKLIFSCKKKSIFINLSEINKLISLKDIVINNKIFSDIKIINNSEILLTGYFHKTSFERENIEKILGDQNLKLDITFEFKENFDKELICFLNNFNISEISYYSINS